MQAFIKDSYSAIEAAIWVAEVKQIWISGVSIDFLVSLSSNSYTKYGINQHFWGFDALHGYELNDY